jgi:ClpP class serine protease
VPVSWLGQSQSVAVVEIRGALVDGQAGWRASVGYVGYQDIRDALAQAYGSTKTRAVLAVISSPGGEVRGMYELMDEIREMKAARPEIPVGVFVDGLAASGGYGLAAALADPGRLMAYDSAIVGNIGVYRLVVDETARLAERGLKVHIAQYPDRKAIGNPARPITDDDAAFHDARSRELAEMFIARVAQARGVTPEAVVALRGEWRIAASTGDDGAPGDFLVDALGRAEDALDHMDSLAQSASDRAPQRPSLASAAASLTASGDHTMALTFKNRKKAAKAERAADESTPADDEDDDMPPTEGETTEDAPPAKDAKKAEGDPEKKDEDAEYDEDDKDMPEKASATFADLKAAGLDAQEIFRAQSEGLSLLAALKASNASLRAQLGEALKGKTEAEKAHLALAGGRAAPVKTGDAGTTGGSSSGAFRSSENPKQDWQHERVQKAYAARYGDRGTKTAFLATAQAMLSAPDGKAEYAEWVNDLVNASDN